MLGVRVGLVSKSLITSTTNVWVGAAKSTGSVVFTWQSGNGALLDGGATVASELWMAGQPDGSGTAAQLQASGLDDLLSTAKRRPLCERASL